MATPLIAVEPIDIREDGKAIDRVNMYASCKSLKPNIADASLASNQAVMHQVRSSRLLIPPSSVLMTYDAVIASPENRTVSTMSRVSWA